jgi:hypothetical protein
MHSEGKRPISRPTPQPSEFLPRLPQRASTADSNQTAGSSVALAPASPGTAGSSVAAAAVGSSSALVPEWDLLDGAERQTSLLSIDSLLPQQWSLSAELQQWPRKPPVHLHARLRKSAVDFEMAHRKHATSACDTYVKMCREQLYVQNTPNREWLWERGLWELRWNRFVTDDSPAPSSPVVKKVKRKAKPKPVAAAAKWFDLYETFWKVRRDCDSDDIYDSDKCYARMVALDWRRALEDGRIARLVERSENKAGDVDDDDDGGELADVEQVIPHDLT